MGVVIITAIGALALLAGAAYSSVLKMSHLRVFFVVWVALWAMSGRAPGLIGPSDGGVLTPGNQPKVGRSPASGIVAKMINGHLSGGPSSAGDNLQVTNEGCISESVDVQVSLLAVAGFLADQPVAVFVLGSGPIPAGTEFWAGFRRESDFNLFNEALQDRLWRSSHHFVPCGKNPTRLAKVKPALEKPQSQDRLDKEVIKLCRFKAFGESAFLPIQST